MFGPLEFSGLPPNPIREPLNRDQPSVTCILCDKQFVFPECKDEMLSHIFKTHKLVIADVDKIASLPMYLLFWRTQLMRGNLKTYCTAMLVDVQQDGVVEEKQEYFLLSDALPMDKELRQGLQRERLEKALEQQRIEREDKGFKLGCLFCRLDIGPSRVDYLVHLSSKHNLYLGKPDNLVYVDQLISTIREKMDGLQCIFCEKFFKDRSVLKEHMRKKQHKRVNPNNKFYDQFYIINYFEKEEKEWDGKEDDEACDWSDWEDKLEVSIVCLFCEKSSRSWEAVICHMNTEHRFHYVKSTSHLGFYQQVKLVNYIRRQVYKKKCINCDKQVESREELIDHMETERHIYIPDKELWDQPLYYFPTYENDAFLSQLDDDDDTSSELSDTMSEMSLTGSEQVEIPVSAAES